MPVIDTAGLATIEKRPAWRGRAFHSPSMAIAPWAFDRGLGMVAIAPPKASRLVRALLDGRTVAAEHPRRDGF